jgi:hypothetical protein
MHQARKVISFGTGARPGDISKLGNSRSDFVAAPTSMNQETLISEN